MLWFIKSIFFFSFFLALYGVVWNANNHAWVYFLIITFLWSKSFSNTRKKMLIVSSESEKEKKKRWIELCLKNRREISDLNIFSVSHSSHTMTKTFPLSLKLNIYFLENYYSFNNKNAIQWKSSIDFDARKKSWKNRTS